MELKRILAANDFSECGNHAMRRAAQLCAQSGAQLRLVHALPGAALTWALLRYSGTEAESSLRNGAQMLLAEFADEFKSRLKLEIDCVTGAGAAHRVISDAVESFLPDLVVVGAHGAGILQQDTLGGTAGKLILQGAHPLLVVRLPAKQAYQTAIAAVDLGTSTQTVVDCARALAPMAQLRVVHAFRAPYESPLRVSGADEARLHAYRHDERLKAQRLLVDLVPDSALTSREVIDGHPASVLLGLTQRGGAELIVAARHSGTRFGDLLLGSVPRMLAFHAECDVLVV